MGLRKGLPLLIAIVVLAGFAPPASAHSKMFGEPVAVDDKDPAGEPGIIVSANGDVFVNAPPGLIGPSFVWRSTDGGSSFKLVGPATVGVSQNGSGVEIGGADSNLASDINNNLYFVDLWLGSSSTAASQDNGDDWFAQPFGSVPIQDRPWVAADPTKTGAGNVYEVTEQLGTGMFLSISNPTMQQLDGTVYPVSILEISDLDRGFVGTAPAGNLVTNQKGDTYNIYAIFDSSPNGNGLGISKLPKGSLSTINSTIPPADNSFDQTQAFPVVAVDNAADDNLYVVWTDPQAPANKKPNWKIRFASFDGQNWSDAVTIGHGVYPWITSGAPGKVDVAWYSAARSGYRGDPNVGAEHNAVWDVAFAQSFNALNKKARFTAPATAAKAVKTGNICTQGSSCSADRELLDFLSIANDSEGHALIAYTFVPQPGTGVVRVVKQVSGRSILKP